MLLIDVNVLVYAYRGEIFTDLCRITKAQGNFVPDAFLAAIAIEAGLEWITTDGGFKRFPDLLWRHPLSPS